MLKQQLNTPAVANGRSLNSVLAGFLTFLFSIFLVDSLASSTSAQQLNAEQARAFEAAKTELKKMKANFDLASNSAGSGTAQPKGSRAKLSKLRLDQASTSIPTVQGYMDLLPADNAAVKNLQAVFDEYKKAIEALDARLAGKSAPASDNSSTEKTETSGDAAKAEEMKPKADAKPKAESKPKMNSKPKAADNSSAAVKLDYKQREALKNARFHLRTVEGGANQLIQVLNEIQKVKEPETISYRKVRQALSTLEDATRKSGFANEHLDGLPGNGEGVADVVGRLKQANNKLQAAKKVLTPLNAMLTKLVDPASYPNLATDTKRLRELGQMFSSPGIFVTDPERAAATYQQSKPAMEEVTRIARTYLRLIEQETGEGERIEGLGNGFLRSHAAFLKAAEDTKTQLPGQIDKLIREIKQMAAGAITEKKPLYFTGGIPQQMGFLTQKLELLTALDADAGKTNLIKVNQLKDELKGQQKSLAKLIIENNRMPNDAFTGADRDKAIEVAIDAWKHQQKEFDVLAKRVPSEAWSRETRWEYNNGTWYFVDRSKLAVYLIVADKDNDDLAIIRPVTIIKNHQKGDTLIGTPMYAGDDELTPNAYMLRSNIK